MDKKTKNKQTRNRLNFRLVWRADWALNCDKVKKKQKNMAAVTGTLIFIFLLCIKKQNKRDFLLSFAEMADLLYMLRVQVNDCVLLRKWNKRWFLNPGQNGMHEWCKIIFFLLTRASWFCVQDPMSLYVVSFKLTDGWNENLSRK